MEKEVWDCYWVYQAVQSGSQITFEAIDWNGPEDRMCCETMVLSDTSKIKESSGTYLLRLEECLSHFLEHLSHPMGSTRGHGAHLRPLTMLLGKMQLRTVTQALSKANISSAGIR